MKKVFEYTGWKYTYPHKTVYDAIFEKHNLDGNDMVEAINKMQEKGDWESFYFFALDEIELCKMHIFIIKLIGNPTNFFKLMEAWLNDGTSKS